MENSHSRTILNFFIITFVLNKHKKKKTKQTRHRYLQKKLVNKRKKNPTKTKKRNILESDMDMFLFWVRLRAPTTKSGG
jgi:hypothetical protein